MVIPTPSLVQQPLLWINSFWCPAWNFPHIKLQINTDCKNPKTKQRIQPRNFFPEIIYCSELSVEYSGYLNCQRNAQIAKKSYKHTLSGKSNSSLLQSHPLSKAWFTNQHWQVAHKKGMYSTLITLHTTTHGTSLPMSPTTEFMTVFLN